MCVIIPDFFTVITSYSIHYTKLYEPTYRSAGPAHALTERVPSAARTNAADVFMLCSAMKDTQVYSQFSIKNLKEASGRAVDGGVATENGV